ncbi:hypothetical protein [Kribbella caucasensis]|uniref:hypothetical protein n=1 Tax=Kribbella caucasensis TaxID=2512215 RepID=UPI00105E84C0|nr:hypothetical protein [Kribbella sp. VKM Ac-2527]
MRNGGRLLETTTRAQAGSRRIRPPAEDPGKARRSAGPPGEAPRGTSSLEPGGLGQTEYGENLVVS